MTTVSKTNLIEVPGILDAAVKAGVNIFAFSVMYQAAVNWIPA